MWNVIKYFLARFLWFREVQQSTEVPSACGVLFVELWHTDAKAVLTVVHSIVEKN